jgi:hypothetical protein
MGEAARKEAARLLKLRIKHGLAHRQIGCEDDLDRARGAIWGTLGGIAAWGTLIALVWAVAHLIFG